MQSISIYSFLLTFILFSFLLTFCFSFGDFRCFIRIACSFTPPQRDTISLYILAFPVFFLFPLFSFPLIFCFSFVLISEIRGYMLFVV